MFKSRATHTTQSFRQRNAWLRVKGEPTGTVPCQTVTFQAKLPLREMETNLNLETPRSQACGSFPLGHYKALVFADQLSH